MEILQGKSEAFRHIYRHNFEMSPSKTSLKMWKEALQTVKNGISIILKEADEGEGR